MADGVEIEDLSIASSIADSDAFLIQQSGTTRQIDFETMRKDAVDKGIVENSLVNETQLETAVAAVSDELAAEQAKIPAQASSSNQLADKDFVNSSIATNTSNFCGTFNSVAELEAYSGAKTNNDYAFVVTTDAAGNTKYNRYKYVEDTTPSWVFEYTLNNSSFTAEQWAAIQSGITAELVALVQNLTVQVPVGVPFPYCGDFGTDPTDPAHKYDLVPAGFLACDGQEVSRETYYRLFGVIGTKFGSGDGSTTFNVPDFRGRHLEGARATNAVGTHLEAGLPNIKGSILTTGTTSRKGAFYAGSTTHSIPGTTGSANYAETLFDASLGETKTDGTLKDVSEHHVYGASDTVQPDSVCVNYIIKY